MSVGGSIIEVTIAGRIFAAAADADSNRELGGFKNELQSNGDGSVRIIKTRSPSMLDGLTLTCDNARGDHEFLQEVADGTTLQPCTMTTADGETYGGDMIVTGDNQYSSQNATVAISLHGTTLRRQ